MPPALFEGNLAVSYYIPTAKIVHRYLNDERYLFAPAPNLGLGVAMRPTMIQHRRGIRLISLKVGAEPQDFTLSHRVV